MRYFKSPAVMLTLVVALAYAPMLVLHFAGLWRQLHYQYFPFVIGAVAYLAWSRYKEGNSSQHVRLPTGWTLRLVVFLAWGLLAVAVVLFSPWLGTLSAILLLGTVARQISRQGLITNAMGIWALLWLLLPLPLGFDKRLVQSLQSLSSRLSDFALDALGVLHAMNGNVLRAVDKDFFVDEACSGIVSVLSVLACAGIYSVWKNRTLAHAIVNIVGGIAWAVVMNVARITFIAFAYDRWQIDLSEGWQHEVLGLCLFSLTFGALVSTDAFLAEVFAPVKTTALNQKLGWPAKVFNWAVGLGDPVRAKAEELSQIPKQIINTGLNWRQAGLIALPFMVLGSLQAAPYLATRTQTKAAIAATAACHEVDENTLGELPQGWVVDSREKITRGEDDSEGHYSITFEVRHPSSNLRPRLSIDYPFLTGWHHLTGCYTFSGWRCLSEDVVKLQDKLDWGFTRVALDDVTDNKALLFYALFNAAGEGVAPPDSVLGREIWQRFIKVNALQPLPTYFQVQLFIPSSLNEVEEAEIKEVFLVCRERIRAAVGSKARNKSE